jgi:hypothetical protein
MQVGAILWAVMAALSQAMPVLDVEDPGACLDREAVAREVALRLPANWVSDGAPPLSLAVHLAPAQGQRAALSLRLLAGDPPEPLLERTVAVAPADCPDLPTLIAVIVARRLEDLPREVWERARAPAVPPARRVVALSLGPELGLDRPRVAGRLSLDALVGPPSGFALALGVAGDTARPEPLGPGRVRFSGLTAHVGLARPVALGAVTLVPGAARQRRPARRQRSRPPRRPPRRRPHAAPRAERRAAYRGGPPRRAGPRRGSGPRPRPRRRVGLRHP